MAQSRVLITGFGPFPGAAENVSGSLAKSLAASEASSCHSLHVEALPTEWDYVSTRGPRLLDELRPRLILHLGLNQRARSFRVERSAHNLVAKREDARGAFLPRLTVLPRGRPRIDTSLPATRIARHLRSQSLPAVSSRSAGSYLCNFLYYLSLDWALRQEDRCDVCFVHVPPATVLSESELLRGVTLTLRYLLAHMRDVDGIRPGRSEVAQASRLGLDGR
jgi:pyroglutamyl-peptidase